MPSALERPRLYFGIALTIIALGGWARLADHANVFTDEGVELKPTDSHYYVRFALRQLAAFPRFDAFDPFVNFPEGAQVLWPPLHTYAVAASIAVEGIDPERAAAYVGPVFAVLELALLALLFRRCLKGHAALGSLTLLALTPVAIYAGALGNADHHVHEPTLAAATSLTFGLALTERSRKWAIICGLLLGLGRFLNPGVFILMVPLAGAAVICAVLWRERSGAIAQLSAWLGGTSAAALLLGVPLFGVWGLSYEQFTLFQPLTALAAFLGAAGVAGLLAKDRRWAIALALAVITLIPLAPELQRAMAALQQEDPLLAIVKESQPLWRYPSWLIDFLGPVLFLAPFGVAGALRWTRHHREALLVPALTCTAAFVLAAALQARFIQPLVGALAVVLPLGVLTLLHEATRALQRTGWVLTGVAALALAPGLLPTERETIPTDEALVRSTMRWLLTHTPSPPDYGVVASQDIGHLLTLWAERPAVATPFSQHPSHLRGNERASQVLAAESDEAAFAAARETKARYVVVIPFQRILGRPNAIDARTLARRLLENAALTGPDATAHFRLVHDSTEQRRRKEGGPYARVFEVVEGALLTGNTVPHAEVTASATVGAGLSYVRQTRADADGGFALPVAYAARYEISAPGLSQHVDVGEAGLKGARIELNKK